jgi:hypothetical protein
VEKIGPSTSNEVLCTRQKRIFALLIGNQNYAKDSGFSSLNTPLADIEAMRKLFSERYGMQTSVDIGGGGKISANSPTAGVARLWPR